MIASLKQDITTKIPIEYPESDGKPMAETDVHRDVIVRIIQLLQAFLAHSVAYVSGNFSQNGFNLNDNGNTATAFPVDAADTPVTTEARDAAIAVRDRAGARGPNFGLDQTDTDIINGVSIP